MDIYSAKANRLSIDRKLEFILFNNDNILIQMNKSNSFDGRLAKSLYVRWTND